MNEVEQKLTVARTRLILDKPFLGALVLRLPLLEAEAGWCATTATDARSFFFNPVYISSLSMAEMQFVLAHEALHCGLSHFARREHRDKRRWDIACDHAVNQMLVEDGLEPVRDALLDKNYAGMTAEEIYPLIEQDSAEEPQDHHLYDGDIDSGDDQSIINSQTEADGKDGSRGQQSDKPPPLTFQEREALSILWQQRLAGAVQQAIQSGKLNGSVGRLVHRLTHSTVPWRTLLARFMSGSNRIDYNLMRPSQRRAGEIIQPSLHTPQTNIVVALDTSGSIFAEELDAFVTEVNAIKGLVNARITMLACDDKLDLDGPWVFEPCDTMTFPTSLSGKGGTDFNPVFDWIHLQPELPDVLIYLTDAKGRFPEKPPPVETLWLVKGPATVPWGQRIQLN